MKLCRGCNETKELNSFYNQKDTRDGKTSRCKECVRDKQRTYEAKNREPARERKKKWYQENRYKAINYSAQWNQEHFEARKLINDRYRRTHLPEHADKENRRRARKHDNGTELYDRRDVYLEANGMCGLCDSFIDIELSWPNPASFSVDHVTPISLGGPDLRSNVQASHLGCNLKKGAK